MTIARRMEQRAAARAAWGATLILVLGAAPANSAPQLGSQPDPQLAGVPDQQPSRSLVTRLVATRDEKDQESEKGPRNLTFDDIKFDMETGAKFERSMLTSKIEELKNKRIRIRGYMLPSYQQRGIKQFVLVRDNMECCFGPGAALYDCIVVEMEPGKTVEYTTRPVSMEGIFSIKELIGPDGNPLAIYHLRGEQMK